MQEKNFYITTPIYYLNGPPHIAHAYTSVACDALARFQRLDGHRVFFVTGTDEHGQKVQLAAQAAGQTPEDFCDRMSEKFRQTGELMDVKPDRFIRTTEQSHANAVAAIWQKLLASGDIYLGLFEGWYSVRDEAFYDESELVDGKAPTGAPVEWLAEENYFFRLSRYQDRLLKLFAENEYFISPPQRRSEVENFVRDGLRDLSISRSSFDWGIPVPGDEKQVIYVWLDALVNYISALNYPDTNSELWKEFWPASVHVVGKDIIRFHCVYWPAFLMAAGIEVPRSVFAHGWWTVEGEKMSKSLGNFIPPQQLVDEFGVDPVRYYLLRELAFGNDGNLTRASILSRTNGDLANGIGNLAHRVLSLVHRHADGAVPEPGSLSVEDQALLSEGEHLLETARIEMNRLAIHKALIAIWEHIDAANRYTNLQAPWKLVEHDRERFNTTLYTLVECIRKVAILTQPFMPSSMSALLDQLGVSGAEREFSALIANRSWPGMVLPAPQTLFGRHV